jgi:D-alanyl-D-alanine-carboxypeptidase/D-alanyl-D-alanine-endopeptidase
MTSTFLLVMLGLLLAGEGRTSQSVVPSQVPRDDAIRKILADRVDTQRQGVGVVVGIIEPQGRRIVSHGAMAADDPRPVGGDSVFEIGSVTKVFTALLLADAVQRGEVALTDPVSKYLPADVKVPERAGKHITLQDLATHTSALPRLPTNLAPKDRANPYADYTPAQMYTFLSSYELTRDIGSRYEYSNLGAGLLGHILARRAGTDYEGLVRTRITGPLKMTSTFVTLTDPMRQRFAAGHNAQRNRVANWDLPTLAGAGALRSTANDLLGFLEAMLGAAKSPLSGALTSMLAVRQPAGAAGLEIALGWHILTTPGGREIVWHNGGTGGYRSFMGFDPKARTGVVVLSNMSTTAGMDDIGRHLLDSSLPLLQPATVRKEVAVNPEILDRYTGKYELAPTFILTITREGNRLFLQATGQPRFELFAEGERDFFLKAVDAQITFEVDSQGRATRLILHQSGAHQPAKRIE